MRRDASPQSSATDRHNVRRLFGARFCLLLRITAALVPVAEVAGGIIPSGADTFVPTPTGDLRPASISDPAVSTHSTRARSEELFDMQTAASEIAARNKIRLLPLAAPPTRSSFMATWAPIAGAAGYRLDVSTSPRFESYVSGFRDLDIGNATGRVVAGLSQGTKYYYRVRAYSANGTSSRSAAMSAATTVTRGLTINATFGGAIYEFPEAQAAINSAIAIYESLFSDPITVSILFSYSPTGPDGTTPLGGISQSNTVVYHIAWESYINSLVADARGSNDASANASLPGFALSTNVTVSSANGRAMGLNTPPAVFANGTVGVGGPFDGIITLNYPGPFAFIRPPDAGYYDVQRSIEHEIDEVLGLGSFVGRDSNLRPQDLFAWSGSGVRNLTANGTRYLSINGGSTGIVYFNQNPRGDFGDWLSGVCPQRIPYVQNAFGCTGQASDITATSPEGINLDVIGYDLAGANQSAPHALLADMNGDGITDCVLYASSTRQTAVWYLNNNVRFGSAYGPTITAGWSLVALSDFNRDGRPDYVLFNPSTRQTAIWYLSGVTYLSGAYGPTLPAGWRLVATGDFNHDAKPDFALFNPSTHQTALWYLTNNVFVSGTYSATLPAGWNVTGVADFDRDGNLDYALFNSSTRQSAIWYLSGAVLARGQYGPVVASGYQLVGTADFDRDAKPDYLLYNSGTRATAMWYLNDNIFMSGLYGPTISAGWSLTAP